MHQAGLNDLLRSGGLAPYASAMPLSRAPLALLVLVLSGCGSGGSASGGDDPASAAPRGAETAFAASQPGAPKPVVAARAQGRVVIAYGEAAAAAALKPEQKLADSATFGDAKALLDGDASRASCSRCPRSCSS